MSQKVVVGVLALQGAYIEHVSLLNKAASRIDSKQVSWNFREIRTSLELEDCHALIIPGGESTAISLVAERSGLLDPLRDFVKVQRKPVWGTCAGLILLAESANRTKKGGQELIGGLDVRVNRNHFGRQTESFEALLDLPFLHELDNEGDGKINGNHRSPPSSTLFRGIFIRAPVVEKILPIAEGGQNSEATLDSTILAPSRHPEDPEFKLVDVEVLAKLPGRASKTPNLLPSHLEGEAGDIIVVKQGNVVGTSFHPELTDDARIHVWWLQQVLAATKMASKPET